MNHLYDNFLSGFRKLIRNKRFSLEAHLLLHNVRQKRSVITQFQSKTRLSNMKSLILILPLLAISFGINITITKFEAYPWKDYEITVTKSGIFSETKDTVYETEDQIKFKCLADRPWKKCWIYKQFTNAEKQVEKLGCKSTHHAGYQVNIIICKVKIGLCLCLN